MENASKALLIAAAILIVLVIISIGMLILGSSKPTIDQAGSASSLISNTINSTVSSLEGMLGSGTGGGSGSGSGGSSGGDNSQDFKVSGNSIIGYTGTDTRIVIPNQINGIQITTIGSNAFFNLSNLESVTIPYGITTIQGLAFFNCTKISRITLPASITSITSYGGGPAFGVWSNSQTIYVDMTQAEFENKVSAASGWSGSAKVEYKK